MRRSDQPWAVRDPPTIFALRNVSLADTDIVADNGYRATLQV